MKVSPKADRTQMPITGQPLELILKEPELHSLKNGSNLYVIREGKDEVTRIDLVVKAGSAYQEKMLVASGVSKLIKEGTQKLTSKQIADSLDFHGAYFEANISKDNAVFSLFTLSKYVKELFPLICSLFFEAVFPEREIKIHLDRQRQDFQVNMEKVRYRAMLEFNKLVFGAGSAYGQIACLDDYQNVNREDIVSFYKAFYNPANAYLIVSGHVEADFIAMADDLFGSQPSHSELQLKKPEDFTTALGDKYKLVEKANSMQSAIRIGSPIMNKLHPDYNKFVLLNTILGGYFGSRLMTNLREDKGLTYGISSFVTNYEFGGYFSISTEVNVEATELALMEIEREMEELRTNVVGEEELLLVKQYLYGTFLRNFDGAFALAERYRSVKDFGMDFGFYKRSLEEMMHTNSRELLEIANTYLPKENMIKLIVGGMGNS